MLQASNNRAMHVKTLVSIGNIFGYTGNTLRVNITRLIRKGTIESDERGLYQLSRKGIQISRYIDSWRDGEKRLKRWNGRWLCFYLTGKTEVGSKKAGKDFGFSGFREGLPNLWIRPDNLTAQPQQVEKLLIRIARLEQGEMFIANGFKEKLVRQWQETLWPVDTIIQTQTRCLEKLEKSSSRVSKMPLENALVESFLMGSEAINTLTNDPLLPREIMDGTGRKNLARAMLAYDELGKQIWSKRFEEVRLVKSPTHLKLAAG